MFKKNKNVASAALPPINETNTINHNYPSRAAVALVGLFGLVLAPVLFWSGLVYLVDQMGFHPAEKYTAWGVIIFIVAVLILGVLGFMARWLANDYYNFKLTMADKQLDLMAQQTRQAQLIPAQTAASMTYDDWRKYTTIKLVMDRVYHQGFIDASGKLLTKSQPWSVRQVGAMTLQGEKSPIGKDSSLASWVAGYLVDRRILSDERTVNLKAFPDLSSVEAQLVKDFGRPISYSGNGGNFAMSGQYINKGNNGGSFT